MNNETRWAATAYNALKATGVLWFLTAVAGQWLFAYYIMIYYGGSAAEGNWAAWTNRMIHGIVEGDLIGNIAVLIHISLAFIITFCGPLQLMPQIRNRFPTFHHWNGRLYITTAFVISLGAIYMIWTREAVIGGRIGQIATSIDAVLIIIFAGLTLRYAMAREIDIHRRWAMRLFIVVNGVWFFRVGRGLWKFLNDGASPGVNGTLTGPFDIFLNFAGFLLPLFFLELYMWMRDRGSAGQQMAMAGIVVVLTAAMGAGIITAAQMFWLPNI